MHSYFFLLTRNLLDFFSNMFYTCFIFMLFFADKKSSLHFFLHPTFTLMNLMFLFVRPGSFSMQTCEINFANRLTCVNHLLILTNFLPLSE